MRYRRLTISDIYLIIAPITKAVEVNKPGRFIVTSEDRSDFGTMLGAVIMHVNEDVPDQNRFLTTGGENTTSPCHMLIFGQGSNIGRVGCENLVVEGAQ